jgi:hypothetical protein
MAANGHGLAIAGKYIYSFSLTSADKRTKVQNKYKSRTKNFQPGTADEQRTKADEMHVSPANAKPNVSCS